jgi:PPK2 family polyphosphate:nucleotide phosphotransferase
MKNQDIAERFRYQAGTLITEARTRWKGFNDPKSQLRKAVKRISKLQEKLYADDRFALLLIFQGMDGAGKDSTIKKVLTGVNPAGFETRSFKAPTYEHNDHNFLWRHWQAIPARGHIGIFNRSYYEEVLVVRVHPEIIQAQQLASKNTNDAFWEQRFKDFRGMEDHLAANGVAVVKFFLNVSKEEQRVRLLARLNDVDKLWKFNPRDVDEREHWDDYQAAFQEAIANTDADHAPWYVVPADDKQTMQAIISSIIAHTLDSLPLAFPVPREADMASFEKARLMLEANADSSDAQTDGRSNTDKDAEEDDN